jgi:hypothetical protein
MNSKSIFELKNIFSTREQLTIGQQLNVKGGDDKRTDARIATPPPPPPTIIIKG